MKKLIALRFLQICCTCVCYDKANGEDEPPDLATLIAANSPSPLDVTVSYISRHGAGSDKDEFTGRVRFRNDNVTLACSADPGPPPHHVIPERLFRNNELLRLGSLVDSLNNVRLDFELTSKKYVPDGRVPSAGEVIVSPSSLGIIGCVDNCLFHEYFPNDPQTQVSHEDEFVVLRSKTRYGEAECRLDPNHSYLLNRMAIKKQGEDLINGAQRRLKELRADNNDPQTTILDAVFTIEAVTYKDQAGKEYIASCTVTSQHTSGRGIEFRNHVEFAVESISFASLQKIASVAIPLKDGQKISLKGAPQIPLVWSERAKWVVPASQHLAESSPTRPNSFRMLAVLAVLTALIVSYYFRSVLLGKGKS